MNWKVKQFSYFVSGNILSVFYPTIIISDSGRLAGASEEGFKTFFVEISWI